MVRGWLELVYRLIFIVDFTLPEKIVVVVDLNFQRLLFQAVHNTFINENTYKYIY